MSAPLRFLAGAIGGWACLRAAMLVPWPAERGRPAAEAPLRFAGDGRAAAPEGRRLHVSPTVRVRGPYAPGALPRVPDGQAPRARNAGIPPWQQPGAFAPPPAPGAAAAPSLHPMEVRGPDPRPPRSASANRWSLSAWALVRRGGSAGLATAPSLGGSQAGASLAYRVAGTEAAPLSLIARLSAPIGASGAEAAAGIEWKPLEALPLRLVAERRQALGGRGRSGLALFAHGGVADLRVGRFRLDGYGQAGLAGRGEMFADGGARITARAGNGVSVGFGVWGAAQKGAARLDFGPTATVRLPASAATLALDWRHRAAGAARPGSGPALTLISDF